MRSGPSTVDQASAQGPTPLYLHALNRTTEAATTWRANTIHDAERNWLRPANRATDRKPLVSDPATERGLLC